MFVRRGKRQSFAPRPNRHRRRTNRDSSNGKLAQKNTHVLRTTSTRSGKLKTLRMCIGLKWIVVVADTCERFVGEKAIERLRAERI